MTKVMCDKILCEHYFEFYCQKDEIELCHEPEENMKSCWDYEEIKEEERI